jgi:hypothetical protein
VSDGLELDLERHVYTYDGQRVSGVSEVLTGLGIVERVWFTEFARARGTAVHLALEYLLTGTLDWTTLDPRIEPYVRAAVRFLEDAQVGENGRIVERPVYHSMLRYAGTPDLVAEVFGERCVIDWKSGGTGAAGLATAAYEMAVRNQPRMGECPPSLRQPLRRMVVQLHDDGTYHKRDMMDSSDYPHWQSAVMLFNSYHLPRFRGVIP